MGITQFSVGVQTPAGMLRLANRVSHLEAAPSAGPGSDLTAESTPRRKAELDQLMKAFDQFTKAMSRSGVSQATLMVRS